MLTFILIIHAIHLLYVYKILFLASFGLTDYFSAVNLMFPDFSQIQKQDYKNALRKYRKGLRYVDICWEKEDIDQGELQFFSL
jgi:hypothetical protein